MSYISKGWWLEPIPDEGIERLHSVWATDFGSCPRQLQYSVHGFESLSPHWFSYRGTLIHQMCEDIINGGDGTVYPTEFPGMEDWILNEIYPLRENMITWFNTTSIDLSEAQAEVKYNYTFDDGYNITRKIDLLTPTLNIDFKSRSGRSVKTPRKDERQGLAMGWWCAYMDDGVERCNMVVYLGGEEPVERDGFGPRATLEKELDSMWGEEYMKLKEQREDIIAGQLMPCYFSAICGMCDYRHICRGI